MNKVNTLSIIKKIQKAKKNKATYIKYYGGIPKNGTIEKLLKEGYRCFDNPSIFGDAIYTITWNSNYIPDINEFEFILKEENSNE